MICNTFWFLSNAEDMISKWDGMDSYIMSLHTYNALICACRDFTAYNIDSLRRHDKNAWKSNKLVLVWPSFICILVQECKTVLSQSCLTSKKSSWNYDIIEVSLNSVDSNKLIKLIWKTMISSLKWTFCYQSYFFYTLYYYYPKICY